MDEVKGFEQMVIAAFCSSEEITPDIKSQAQINLIQAYQNLQTIQFCIVNFDKFENETAKLFTVNLIHFWLKEKSDEISQEILQVFQPFLFSPFFMDNFHTFPKAFADQLISSQSQFVKHVFPTIWPNFFAEIIFCQNEDPQNLHDNYVKQFLAVFTADVCEISPYTFTLNRSLWTALAQAEIWNNIFLYSVQKIASNDLIGYNIFRNAVKFCDINLFSQPEIQQLILQSLSNPEALIHMFIALRNIIERPMPEENRQQMIAAFINPDMFVEIIKNVEDLNVSAKAADLIASALLYLQSFNAIEQQPTEPPIPYYTIALNFIQLDDITASRTIYPILSSLIKYPSLVIETDKVLINRLVENFSEATVLDTFEETLQNAEKYINTIVSSITPEIPVLDLIESYVPAFNIAENPGLCSTMIYLVNKLKLRLSKAGKLDSYLQLFSTLLEAEQPLSPAQILAFYLFERFAVNSYNEITSEQLSAIITVMMQITLIDDMDPKICNYILKLFPTYQFEKKKQKKMDAISSELIDTFIQSGKSDYAIAASKLVQTMEDETKAAYNQKCLEFYAQALSSEPDLNVYSCLLAYLSVPGLPPAEPISQLANELLENSKSQQLVLENSDTLCNLILSMNQMSFPMIEASFPEIFPLCTSLASIQVLCSTLCQHSAIANQEWMPVLIDSLFVTIRKNADDYLVSVYMGSNSSEIEITIVQFYRWIGLYLNTILKSEFNEYLSTLITNALQLIQRLSNRLYNSWKIQSSFLSFLYDLSKPIAKNHELAKFLESQIPPLFPTTFNIIFSDPLNLVSDGWKDVMLKISSVHKAYYNKLGMDDNFFVAQLQQFGVPPEFTAGYLAQIPKEIPNNKEAMRQNIHDIYLFFRNLNV